jgi:anti-sigma B factor antagonist
MPVREAASHPEFSIEVAEADGRVRVSVSGDVDLVTAPRLQEAVEQHLPDRPVLLDLTGVGFLDSSGVRVLDRLLRLGGDLRIARQLAPNVEQVLRLTGMLDVLPVDDA